jgi:hypothetical protein
MNRVLPILGILFLAVLLPACDIKENTAEPLNAFVRIYESGQFETSIFPTDIRPTSDSGFVILGHTPSQNSSFHSVYLMKIAKDGSFQWEHVSDQYVNPVSELMPANGGWQFFCMDEKQFGTHLVQVGQTPQSVARIAADSLKFPVAAGAVSGGYLLQVVDDEYKNTKLLRLNGSGGISWTQNFEIFEEVEEKLVDHLTYQRRLFPFFVGETLNGNSYFNGFSNFTLSLNFVASGNGRVTGAVINGERYDAGISNAVAINGSQMAMARYNADGALVFVPRFAVNTNADALQAAKDIVGNQLPELNPFARVLVRRATIGGKNVVLYGSDTKNGQIALFAYDEATGNLLGTRYLGASNGFEIGGFTLAQDGGMAVAGRTYVAGRFPRLVVFKLSPQDVTQLVSQISPRTE